MATQLTKADAVQWLHSGATSVGAAQAAPTSCLGGNRSGTEVQALAGLFDTPIPQIAIERILGGNGTGEGTLTVTGASTVKYTGPGGTIGTAVTIANGETHLVEDTATNKAVRISRDSATALALDSAMTLNIMYPFGNAVAMPLVAHADRAAGLNTYSGIFAYSSLGVTLLKVWIKTQGTQRATGTAQLGATGAGTITTATASGFADWPTSGWARIQSAGGTLLEIVYYTSRTATSLTVPAAGRARLGTSTGSTFGATDLVDAVPGIRIAKEAPTAGVIQTIATAATAPTAVTWNTGITSATGLDIGTLGAAGDQGLWIHREIPAGAMAHADLLNSIAYSFTYSAVSYTQALYGAYAMADTGLTGTCIWVATDADPDRTGAPTNAGALPLTYAVTPPGAGTAQTRIKIADRNAYGLIGFSDYIRVIEVDSTGAEVTQAPTAPSSIALTQGFGGDVLVSAVYYPDQDASPANYFRIYYDIGADPVVGVAAYTDVAVVADAYFLSPAYRLAYSLGPFSYGADVRVLVRTYRSSDTTPSTNTTVSTLAVTTTAPGTVQYPGSFYGEGYNQTFVTPSNTTTTYVDQPNNIYFVNDSSGTSFYANTALIWRWMWLPTPTLYIPNTWDIDGTTTVTGTNAAAISVPSWTVGDKRIAINVGGNTRISIDVTNEVIYAGDVNATALGGYYQTNAPYYGLALETVLNGWRASTIRMETYVHVNATAFSGALTFDNVTYDQAAIEAL